MTKIWPKNGCPYTPNKQPFGCSYKTSWQARRDSNPQHAVLETAALPIGATGLFYNFLNKPLSSFLVQSVLVAPLAILLELDTVGIVLLVLLGRVITALTFCARQCDQCTHE